MGNLLEVRGLTVSFGGARAVDEVSFQVSPGERVGLIGESGSGKSMVCLAVQGLQPRIADVSGSVVLEGEAVHARDHARWRTLRGRRIGTVFQEPMTALNPVMTIGAQLTTALRHHGIVGRREAGQRAVDLAAMVGLPDPRHIVTRYPHQLSGGQRQRVVIAMALSCEPALVLADEPTTALDATVARKVLELMVRLCEDVGSALLLVTHDMGVAASTCERLMVMRRGLMVEQGTTAALLAQPRHDYTRNLVAAARSTGLDLEGARALLAARAGRNHD